eukprot:6186443-Pleurochrysis_carterae.AAC.1
MAIQQHVQRQSCPISRKETQILADNAETCSCTEICGSAHALAHVHAHEQRGTEAHRGVLLNVSAGPLRWLICCTSLHAYCTRGGSCLSEQQLIAAGTRDASGLIDDKGHLKLRRVRMGCLHSGQSGLPTRSHFSTQSWQKR